MDRVWSPVHEFENGAVVEEVNDTDDVPQSISVKTRPALGDHDLVTFSDLHFIQKSCRWLTLFTDDLFEKKTETVENNVVSLTHVQALQGPTA